MLNGDSLRGILSFIPVFIFIAILIFSIPLTLLVAKVHMIGVVVNYLDLNKAHLALISILSKKEGGKSYADIIVERIVKGQSFDGLKIDRLLEKMGFDCYRVYVKEGNIAIAEKSCDGGKTVKSEVKVPLPNLEYKTLILEVGSKVD